MYIGRKLPASLLSIGLLLAAVAVACGGKPAESPNSSPVAGSASTSNTSAPELNGVYKVTGETTGVSTWTVTPCGEGCVDVAVEPETTGEAGGTLEVPFRGQAHLKNGEWSMSVIRTDGYVCEDGTDVTVDAIYSWDATSLKGSWDATLHEPGCGDPAGSGTGPPESFTLLEVR